MATACAAAVGEQVAELLRGNEAAVAGDAGPAEETKGGEPPATFAGLFAASDASKQEDEEGVFTASPELEKVATEAVISGLCLLDQIVAAAEKANLDASEGHSIFIHLWDNIFPWAYVPDVAEIDKASVANARAMIDASFVAHAEDWVDRAAAAAAATAMGAGGKSPRVHRLNRTLSQQRGDILPILAYEDIDETRASLESFDKHLEMNLGGLYWTPDVERALEGAVDETGNFLQRGLSGVLHGGNGRSSIGRRMSATRQSITDAANSAQGRLSVGVVGLGLGVRVRVGVGSTRG